MLSRCVSMLLLVMLVTCVGCFGPVKGVYPSAESERPYEVMVVNNHWHTGLVMHREMLSPRLRQWLGQEATGHDASGDSIEIGWGDDGFYRSKKVTSGLTVQAVFFSRGSVIHATTLPAPPVEFYQDYDVTLHRLTISRAGLDRLCAYLERAFAVDASGNAIYLEPGLTQHSSFYRGRGRYGGWHTCNHWTADAIRSTGFPITPIYGFTADNVGWQIERGRGR